jgi:hypothetical protein
MRDITDFNIPIVMAICNRGGSKTMLTSYSTNCLLDNLDNFRVSILSGSKKQASQAYRYCSDVFKMTDCGQKVLGDVTQSKTEMLTGGGLEILSASPKSTRAPRADMIIIDEACSAKSSILQSVFGQIITAEAFKLVILTTPDQLVHIAKEWWDKFLELGIVRYHWDAYQCNWIPRVNIERLKLMYDSATFDIEVMAKWTSKAGSAFRNADIEAATITMADLPSFDEVTQFFMGIDWGDAHKTVATVVGYTGNIYLDTDMWYVFAVEAWQRAYIEEMIGGISELGELFAPVILSEQSSVSAFANRELRDSLSHLGLRMVTGSFSGKKNRMVANTNMRLERRKLKIPKKFKMTLNQMKSYHKKVIGDDEISEEFEKKFDDYVDSIVWANWGVHPKLGGPVTIGEWKVETGE